MSTKRINPEAYAALVDCLATIYFNKRPLARFLQLHLRDHPELLSGLNVTSDQATKREVADELVERLARSEDRLQSVTLDLMAAAASFGDFSNLRQHEDGEQLLARATEAQVRLKRWVDAYSDVRAAQERLIAEAAATEAETLRRRSWDTEHDRLRDRLIELHAMDDEQKRGLLLEGLLNELFTLYDLAPRGAFRLVGAQIDGAFTHNTDDYVLEAKWEKSPTGPADLHVLKGKVDARAKNVMGLFLSVNGFTPGGVDAYRHGTALLLMHGTDLYAILDRKIDLRDLLERKRRHASETGNPLLSATEILAG
jgi:hypothetical protein